MAPKYDNEELTINPTQVFSVHNWMLKPNQPKEPPFTDHMTAICNLVVPVDFKAPEYSSPTEEGMDEGTKTCSFSHILVGSNPSVLVDKTKSIRDGLKTAHTTSSSNKESGADDILRNVKLEDLADILKDTRSAFFTSDSPTDEPIIVSYKKGLEQAKVTVEAEVASMKAKPSYPDINQLTELLVAELKNIQWELPPEFLDLPHLASSVQEKLKTLDSLPCLLKTVTNTLNRFATLVENALGATTTGVPSANKATASPAEGDKDKVYKAGKRLLYAKRNKAISIGKGASKVSREPLPPSLSPSSAKLMIMVLEEYGYQSRRGTRLLKK
uniref:Uncharacterized protein n=1 Tax=Tanacetum cinerariifolium TaxID=118510 RepID=A0A699I8P0_TANCI|nr:hypothetical protein [Tanacetum cinerariifolium]